MRHAKQTATSSNTLGFSAANDADQNQSYAPYFIASLRDQIVHEGESVLFEIVVSGRTLNMNLEFH
jgi:hypothetical protein